MMLFDSPFAGLELGARKEYEPLLDFRKNPEQGKIRRVASIVRAHQLLFASGLVAGDDELEAEIPPMLRYLESLAEKSPIRLNKSNIVPQNLGSAFARKRLGAPLFGPHRPPSIPSRAGLILRYQAIEADGVARLSAARSGADTAIRYRGIGTEFDSSAQWLHCAVSPAGVEPLLTPGKAFSRTPTTFRSDSHTVYLAASKTTTRLRAAAMDPFRYQYAYYFFDDGCLRANLSRFLGDLLSGVFGFTAREAEPIAALFIERSS